MQTKALVIKGKPGHSGLESGQSPSLDEKKPLIFALHCDISDQASTDVSAILEKLPVFHNVLGSQTAVLRLLFVVATVESFATVAKTILIIF